MTPPARENGVDQATNSTDVMGDSEATNYGVTPTDPDASDYAAAPSTLAPRSGTFSSMGPFPCPFGDYELLERIAGGGMGVVYRARQIHSGRMEALKMILPEILGSDEAVGRFRAEARMAANLEHKNIVPIYAVGQVEGKHYFTMQLIRGGSLADVLRDGPLEPRLAARLVAEVAEAVQYAHDRELIHRDIKPANVLLHNAEADRATAANADTWTPMLADFGLARERESSLSYSGAVVGTPSFMAPEQAAGRPEKRSDVYALGAVLYCLLTSRPPFQAANVMTLLLQVMETDPVPPHRLNPSVHPDLEAVCLKCLDKAAGRRYGTAGELAADLGRYLAGEPTVARPVGGLERTIKWCRRRPAVAALFAVVLFAAVGGALFLSWNHQQKQEEQAKAHVQSLASAETSHVPRIIADLGPYRTWADPLLRRMVEESPPESKERLHASLALAPVDPSQCEYLYTRLLRAEPQQVAVILDGLWPYRSGFIDRLWVVVEDPETSRGQRLRAACALARFDANNPRWRRVAPDVVVVMSSESPLFFQVWTEQLSSVRGELIRPLVDLLLCADLQQYGLLNTLLLAYRQDAVACLLEALDQSALPDAEKEVVARRQARAAAALLSLGETHHVWKLFQFSSEPHLRGYLVNSLSQLGVDYRILAERLEKEPNTSAMRAILQGLGDFDRLKIPVSERTVLIARLRTLYRDHPDPGVHSSVEWLLRQWGDGDHVLKVDQVLTGRPRAGENGWWVNPQGHTLVIVAAPGEFSMGRSARQPSRGVDTGSLQRVRLPRSFAIATKEVTVEQYRRFREAHPSARGHEPDYSPEPRCPINAVTWYEAAKYCRWLSEQEGVPEEEMCFPRVEEIKEGMELPKDYLSRTGYRLPTDAEWEYACRVGTATLRYYGDSDELLDRYAWSSRNCDNRSMPVGLLRPNDIGLFDMYGNVYEWCQQNVLPTRSNPVQGVVEDLERDLVLDSSQQRPIRGGAFNGLPRYIYSAERNAQVPGHRTGSLGFRVVRTCR